MLNTCSRIVKTRSACSACSVDAPAMTSRPESSFSMLSEARKHVAPECNARAAALRRAYGGPAFALGVAMPARFAGLFMGEGRALHGRRPGFAWAKAGLRIGQGAQTWTEWSARA